MMQLGIVQPYYRGFAWTILDPSILADVDSSYVTRIYEMWIRADDQRMSSGSLQLSAQPTYPTSTSDERHSSCSGPQSPHLVMCF
jgi:hypothetical protein